MGGTQQPAAMGMARPVLSEARRRVILGAPADVVPGVAIGRVDVNEIDSHWSILRLAVRLVAVNFGHVLDGRVLPFHVTTDEEIKGSPARLQVRQVKDGLLRAGN